MYKLLLPLLLVSSTLSAQVNRSHHLDSMIIATAMRYSGLDSPWHWEADTVGTRLFAVDSSRYSWNDSGSMWYVSRSAFNDTVDQWTWIDPHQEEIRLLTSFRKAADAYINVLDLDHPVTGDPNVWVDHLWQCRKRYIGAKKALQIYYKKNPQR